MPAAQRELAAARQVRFVTNRHSCYDSDGYTCYIGYDSTQCVGASGDFDPDNGCPIANRLGCCEGANGGTANFANYAPMPAATAKNNCEGPLGGTWKADEVQ